MESTAFKKKNIEVLILWAIPTLCFLTSFLYWFIQDRLLYFGYLCITPLVFVGLAVNVAAGPLKLWQWCPSIFPQGLYFHRPLVYTAYFNLVFLLTGRLLMLSTDIKTLLESALVVGVVGMMVGVIHDIFGVDVGLYKISGRRFDREKYGTILVVSRYGFYFFGAISVFMGLAAKIGYYFLYETQPGRYSWFTLGFLVGFLASLPILAWAVSRFLIKTKKHTANKISATSIHVPPQN